MARGGRALYLPVMIAAAVLVACAVVLLAVSEEAGATFPGKNGRIAYSASGPRGDAIYTISPGGTGNTRVTGGYLPSYSPDGERIAYTRTLRSSSPDTEIYEIYEIFTVKVGGGGKTRVTYGQNPSYSPDGKRIVYEGFDDVSSKRFPDLEIYTINVRGGDKTQLTHNNKDDLGPDYSPDGKRIAYAGTTSTQDEESGESDIYTIKVGGGDKSRVTNTDKADEYFPSYSPDGKKIAYTLYKTDIQSDIYTIDASGGGRTRVTNTDNAYVQGPSWGSRP